MPSLPSLSQGQNTLVEIFAREWDPGKDLRLRFTEFLDKVELNDESGAEDPRRKVFAYLLDADLEKRLTRGDEPRREDYLQVFPEYQDEIEFVFEETRPRTRAAYPQVTGYEVLEELGRGGMGVVYKARDLKLNCVVALKTILAQERDSCPDDLTRFRNEAEAMARLHHPNIVQVFDIGEYNSLPFFTMEFCPGSSLDKTLTTTRSFPARATESVERWAAQLVETLAHAIHYAHSQGIVHRDLKPANVLLLADGTPKITDFGLAKQLNQTTGLTSTGVLIGTPSYMAPEQASARTWAIGPAVDIWALGVILYEMLGGAPAFRGPSLWNTLSQVQNEVPWPPRCSRGLQKICLKCLEKEPGKRYADCQALANDLRRWQEGKPLEVEESARRQARELSRWRWLLGTALVVAAAVAAWFFGFPTAAALVAGMSVVVAAAWFGQ